MDRLASDLGPDSWNSGAGSAPAIPLADTNDTYADLSARRLAMPERLFHLRELDVMYDEGNRTLWSFMNPSGRPSFTMQMLRDLESWQLLTGSHFGPGKVPLDFLVLGCRIPGVFSFGGDLSLFQRLIRDGDRAGLTEYAHLCVEVVHRSYRAVDLPIVTVGLNQGQALGGGFEALLSFDVIIAERGATFGLPEVMFGLFPGMGAHALLTRKLGTAMAEKMILSNRIYTAEEMYEMGLVSVLAEPGEGLAATREFVSRTSRRHAGMVAAKRASRLAAPITLQEMVSIVDLWVEAALSLNTADLKLMNRLTTAQSRHSTAA